MKLCVAAIQMVYVNGFHAALTRAQHWFDEARRAGVQLVVLPEYWFSVTGAKRAKHAREVYDFYRETSRRFDLAVAGNLIEATGKGLINKGVVCVGGQALLEQPKIHPMPREIEQGIRAGDRFAVANVLGVPTGILVCSDVIYPEAARVLAIKGAKLLLNPVMSPRHANDLDRESREALYVARAWDSGAFVVKAGGVGEKMAGRSLVAAPWGLLARYKDDGVEELLVAELEFDELEAFRRRQERFPPRRPEAYGGLCELSRAANITGLRGKIAVFDQATSLTTPG